MLAGMEKQPKERRQARCVGCEGEKADRSSAERNEQVPSSRPTELLGKGNRARRRLRGRCASSRPRASGARPWPRPCICNSDASALMSGRRGKRGRRRNKQVLRHTKPFASGPSRRNGSEKRTRRSEEPRVRAES